MLKTHIEDKPLCGLRLRAEILVDRIHNAGEVVVVFVAKFAPALPPYVDDHGQQLGVDRFAIGSEDDEELAAVIVGQSAFGEAFFGQNINDPRYGGGVFGG